MHHDDIRAGIDLFVRPFFEPVRGSQPFRQLFEEKRRERAVQKNVIVFVHDHQVGMLPRFADALQNALLVLRVRLVPRFGRQQRRGFVWLAAGFDAQLIHARTRGGGRSSLCDQTRGHGHQRNRALRRVQITGRDGFLHVVADPGVNDVAAFYFAQGVLNTGNLKIERMIIGQRQQIEAQNLQRVERFGRGEKPARRGATGLFPRP